MQKLGIVICDRRSPNQFRWAFQAFENASVTTNEFVQVAINQGLILGKIAHIVVSNEFFADQDFVKRFVARDRPVADRYPTESRMIKLAHVRTLGLWNKNTFHPPSMPPLPGSIVTEVASEVLNEYLGVSSNNSHSLFLGKILNQELPLLLDPNKLLPHHVAILGATGSGKSYTCGVLCEELLESNIPIVVIDAHGEYGMNERNDGMAEANSNQAEINLMKSFGIEPKRYLIQEYAPVPSIKSKNGKTWQKSLRFDISKQDSEILGELMGLNSEPQFDLLYLSLKFLKDKKKESYGISDLENAMEYIRNEYSDQRTFLTLKRRLEILSRLNIFGQSFDPKEIVRKGILTVIDLSGDIDERVRRVVCAALLTELFEARKRREIPPYLIVIEEGHRFCPQEEDCASKHVIRRIAREGRKFGVSVCITSQRVIGLDKDVLSQCGTKITLRIDNKSDLDYIRPYLSISYSEEFGMIPLLSEGVAIISGFAVRTPVVFKVRIRKSMHGGTSAEFMSNQT
jgi:hypothetical protein